MAEEIGESGLLTAVFWQWIGTELALDAATDATTIFVRNPETLSPNEYVWISETGPYRVLTVDDTAVTLDTGLIIPAEEAEPVVPDMGGMPGQVWYAEVVLPDNDEPIEVMMTWQDRLLLPEGEYDPPRAIILSPDLLRIVDVPFQAPSVPIENLPVDEFPPDPEAVQDYIVEYAVNQSETTAPTTGWSPDTPTRNPGDYIWFRTLVTKRDGTQVTTSPALMTGNDGAPGEQGIPGPPGADGTSLYTWLKYADSPTTGMSDSPTGKAYLGLAYNKTTATESSNYSDYQWSKIEGDDGAPGVPGPPGPSGESLYTWVKYGTSAAGANLSDDPTGKDYIGLAYNKTTATESTNPADYQWALIQGEQGPQGVPGSPGTPGQDGASLYTWLKYADSPTSGMSDSPTGKTYMGLAYNKTSPTESNVYADYDWSLIQGPEGDQGVPGPPGSDGSPTYTWVKYADSAAGAGLSDSPTGKTYIGFAFNKTTPTESSTPGDYTWSLIQGPQGSQGVPGPPGADGSSLYTWIKYADTPTTGMSDSPAGKTYMGIAYNKTSATESSTYGDYEWSLIQGPEGDQGVPGPPGSDGQPTYTWIKYGDSAAGAGLSDSSTGKSYIGIAYNKTTQVESTNPADYEWSLIQGPQGPSGGTGPTGVSVTGIMPYFAQVASGAAPPAKPGAVENPPAPWVTPEPTFVPNTDLYRTERVSYSNGTFSYTTVSMDSTYDAAKKSVPIYPQDDPPWATGTANKPHGSLWIETDNDNHVWFWDTGTMEWLDGNDPALDLLDDISQLPVGPDGVTLGEIATTVENTEQTARSARNLAATADGRVSMSDYDPAPEDTQYYATDAAGNLLRGESFVIEAATLTNGLATLEMRSDNLQMPPGSYIVVTDVGEPFDGTWTLEEELGGVPASFTYRITGQANVPRTVLTTPGTGYNTVIMNRTPGSVWFTRTRSRLNLLTNPSFEVDTTGWAVAFATTARVDVDTFIGGDWVLRVTNDASTNDHRAEWAGGTPGMVVQPGQTYAVTCFALLAAGQPESAGVGCYASVRFYRTDGSFYSEVNGEAVQLTAATGTLVEDDWRELKVSASVPEVTSGLPIGYMTAAVFHNPNPSAVWYLDGALVEEAEFTGRYFDGNSYDAVWGNLIPNTDPPVGDGTPHASFSSMEGGKIVSVYELYDGDWVRLDFTDTTQYDSDAGDLTKGTLNPDRIADRSIDPEKLLTNIVITQFTLAAGDFVNVYASGGSFFLRKADANLGYEAHGFTLNSATAGSAVPVFTVGYNPLCTGLLPGRQFLSATTPGKASSTPPNGTGQIIQQIGFASDATTLHFNPQPPVLLS